jgi:hypothetical protein
VYSWSWDSELKGLGGKAFDIDTAADHLGDWHRLPSESAEPLPIWE